MEKIQKALKELSSWYDQYFTGTGTSVVGIVVEREGVKGFDLVFCDDDISEQASKRISKYEQMENRDLLLMNVLSKATTEWNDGKSYAQIYQEQNVENLFGYSERHFRRLINKRLDEINGKA